MWFLVQNLYFHVPVLNLIKMNRLEWMTRKKTECLSWTLVLISLSWGNERAKRGTIVESDINRLSPLKNITLFTVVMPLCFMKLSIHSHNHLPWIVLMMYIHLEIWVRGSYSYFLLPYVFELHFLRSYDKGGDHLLITEVWGRDKIRKTSETAHLPRKQLPSGL